MGNGKMVVKNSRPRKSLEAKGIENLNAETIKKIDSYIEGEGNLFTSKEIQEIKDNMQSTKKSLYRLEDLSWMGENLENGDVFEFDKPLKGFTQDWNVLKVIASEGEDAGLYEGTLAIYQTVDNTQHLDISGISKNHAEEKESLVGGKFKVIDQYDGPKIGGYDTWIFVIKQVKDKKKKGKH